MHTAQTDGFDRFLPPRPAGGAAPGTRRAQRKPWWLVLCMLAGGVAGFAGVSAGKWLAQAPFDLPAMSAPWALAWLVLMLWPNIVLHEAGHALAGMARGLRPFAFGIGPLRWERGQSGWRFRRGGGVGGIAGFAALLPHGGRGQSRGDQALYLAGGPLANLATAGACGALLLALRDAPHAGALLVGTGIGALLLGLTNLLPFHSQGWRSDGQGLLDLARGRPDARLALQAQQLLALGMAGVRPRDWPDALVPPDDPGAASPVVAMNNDLLRLAWAMDRGDDAGSAQVAARLTARYPALPPAIRPHVAVSLAWHAARHLRDAGVLAAWRPLCEGGVLDLSLLRAWLDAELAALSGDPAGRRDAVARARAALGHALDPATVLQVRERLDALAAGDDALAPQPVKHA